MKDRQSYVFNFSGGYRQEVLDGRDCLVVSVVPLVPGVHTGMDGNPTYYSPEALSTAVSYNNGRPIVVNHPGAGQTANRPDILEDTGVGTMFNLRYADGKWRADLWIDVEKGERIMPTVMSRIRNHEVVEVSTGLYGRWDQTPGVWNGEDYTAAAGDLILDHLAILPDAVGACSVADGCGIHANKSDRDKQKEQPMISRAKAWLRQFIQQEQLEASHDDVRRNIQALLDGMDNGSWMHWVRDVYDNKVIYEASTTNPSEMADGQTSITKLYERSYTVDDDGVVTLGEEAQEVIEERNYVPVDNAGGDENPDNNKASNDKELKTMEKEQKVKALIACEGTRFEDGDKDWLMALEEGQLDKLAAPETPEPKPEETPDPEPKEEPTEPKENAEAESKAPTFEGLLANASQEHRELWAQLEAERQDRRDKLVSGLTENKACKFTSEELQAKPLAELEKMSELAAIPVTYAGNSPAPVNKETAPVPPPLVPLENVKE